MTVASEVLLGGHLLLVEGRQTLVLVFEEKKGFSNFVTLACEVLLGATSSSLTAVRPWYSCPRGKRGLSNLVTLAGEVLIGGHLLLVDRRQNLVLVPKQKRDFLTL